MHNILLPAMGLTAYRQVGNTILKSSFLKSFLVLDKSL